MHYMFDGFNYAVRLDKGERLSDMVVGGHVKDLVAGVTVEIFIHPTYKPLRRTYNPEAGLRTLNLHADA